MVLTLLRWPTNGLGFASIPSIPEVARGTGSGLDACDNNASDKQLQALVTMVTSSGTSL